MIVTKKNGIQCKETTKSMYHSTCFEPLPTPLSRGGQGQQSKLDHPSSRSYNVSDRDVNYDISAELALNHPGTK